MDKGGDALCLRSTQHGEAGIATHAYHRIRHKATNDPPHLEKAFDQLKRKTDVLYQRASVKTRYIDAFDLITRLRHLFHLHFSFGAYKKELNTGILLSQSACNGNRGKYMPPRTAARYDDLLVHAVASSLCSSPSFSTLRATLRMMPMARQVNKKELPPILTSGRVTPVTGNRFTFTAIFANAWITRVKLSPNARNAPKAKGHLRKILMLRNKKI